MTPETPGGTAFREVIAEGTPVVFDGAMGSTLYEQGILHTRAFEECNITAAAKVKAVHLAFIEAGANVIETNTFGANKFTLGKYGLQNVAKINTAGVEIAKEAVAESGKGVWVAGAVGPTGEGAGFIDDDKVVEITEAYTVQIKAMVQAGVDIIMLETFTFLSEIKIALKVTKSLFSGPVIASMSFSDEPESTNDYSPGKVGQMLAKWGADVVGVNCGGGWGRVGEGGPAAIYDVAEEMVRAVGASVPVIALPNAGHPKRVGHRNIYMATEEYFLVYAKRLYKSGVKMVGGCCGTKPHHIHQVASAARMFGGGNVIAPPPATDTSSASDSKPNPKLNTAVARDPIPVGQRTKLSAKVRRIWEQRLGKGTRKQQPIGPEDFVVSVEVNPAPGLSTDKPMGVARILRAAGVDVVNIADGPRATVRMSNTALAEAFQQQLDGCETIVHVCCRDRNLLGLMSDLLGNYTRNLHNLVIITGDPPKMGDYPKATAVFDLDSIGLLKLVKGLNGGVDPAGRDFGGQARFFCATGAEPGAVDYAREMKRLKEKIDAGAEMIMTQPIYDATVMRRFLDDVMKLARPVPVLMGLCPLVSSRNAEFLHNEVPGMSVPQPIRDRMAAAGGGPTGIAEGVKIAKEMLDEFKCEVVGCYIMPQLGKYEAAVSVLEDLGYGKEDAVKRRDGAQ